MVAEEQLKKTCTAVHPPRCIQERHTGLGEFRYPHLLRVCCDHMRSTRKDEEYNGVQNIESVSDHELHFGDERADVRITSTAYKTPK